MLWRLFQSAARRLQRRSQGYESGTDAFQDAVNACRQLGQLDRDREQKLVRRLMRGYGLSEETAASVVARALVQLQSQSAAPEDVK